MKKNISVLILGILTITMLSGCANKTADTTKKDSQVTKVEQSTDTKLDHKKDDVNPEVKPEVKEEVKTDVPKETVVTEAPKPAVTPTVTETKTSSTTTTKPTTTVTTPTPKPTTPTPTPAPTPVVEKKSGIADINDAWRIRYFRLDATSYTGDKVSEFDDITLKVATGNLSGAVAETQLKSLKVWKETKTGKDCQVLDARITVYTTSTNDVMAILKECNNKNLFRGDTYSNSYIYYDASIKQNRVVMIGIALPSTF